MAKENKRMGKDPLAWIEDSRDESKQSKSSKPNVSSKQSIQKTSSQAGLKDGWTRATFIIQEQHLEKLKALAWWDRKELKKVLDEALTDYLKDKRVRSIPVEE